MDKDRQIRFLYPPLIFIGSIALGVCFDKSTPIRDEIGKFIANDNNVSIAAAILAAGSLVLLLGFVIGTITVCLLKAICFKNDFNYEMWLSEKSYAEIGNKILRGPNKKIRKEDRLYAVASFDHGFISQRVHQWIVRRWNGFFISSASVVALGLSLLIGWLLKVSFCFWWLFVAILFIMIFTFLSYRSWVETMRMIEFQLKVKEDNNEKEVVDF